MKRLLRSLLVLFLAIACQESEEHPEADYPTPYENGNGNQTPTYAEVLDFYMELAREFPEVNIQTLGETDSGQPLHLVTYNPDGNFNFQRLGSEKTVVLVLNGIHPGESDGIDASMLLLRDLATGAIEHPENLVLAVIPVYNIGGALQRNSTTRANQNGPETYGFRGNARNFDLNRDFVKMDTRNAQTFAAIFHLVRPDFFIDTHVSNGADYTYTLTHLFTQHDKLGGSLGRMLESDLRPALEADLRESGWEITPYVNVFNRPPDGGFTQFLDHPRYSTGYAALWNTPGLMLETHMLKPYPRRVEGTYAFLRSTTGLIAVNGFKIRKMKEAAVDSITASEFYPLRWTSDSTRVQTLQFKGYAVDTLPSVVTGQMRLRYDPSRPIEKSVPYYNGYRASDSVRIPAAYLVPAQWTEVKERLDWNGIRYRTLEADTTLKVTSYRISEYQTYSRAYEGHYPHYNTEVEADMLDIEFKAGDLWVPTAQAGLRYLMETLEPEAVDSFFNWNFFDSILQKKEGFSPYVFEEVAAELLAADSLLRAGFEARRAADPGFASNAYAQLNWIYNRSPYREASHLRYPIYRLE
jgi:hypothetical protein